MPELSVSRKNIGKLFSEMRNKKYIIPEYQRPYDWDLEKCETLWNDIVSFFEEKSPDQEYFLGTIVSCKSENTLNEIEVIDGQQRITSLFLLLRAFYSKLEMMSEDINVRGLKSQIAPCIWDVDEISMIVNDKSKIHLESRVSTAQDNEVLQKILFSGSIENGSAKSKYAENYRFFFDRCEEYARMNPLKWQPLCVAILQSCIVLPIDCEKEDTALTIFNTLNDRGLPLADSDIFKAQMYKNKESGQRKEFATRWKELREECEKAQIQLDELFRYYSHYLRAIKKDKSKEIGLRRFYAENKYEKLKTSVFVDDLELLCGFWSELNNYRSEGARKLTFDSLKYIHCLQSYPNEFWKYLVSVHFLKHKDDKDFEANFALFLKRIISFLFAKFIERPTVNAIRDDVYQGVIDLWFTGTVNFKYELPRNFLERIEYSHKTKIARGLILLHSYLNSGQAKLLPKDFEIEHIFPRKWQNTNYDGWTTNEAEEQLERFGNKVAIEEKLNIQAGNGYFGKKKAKYAESKVANVTDLAGLTQNDWRKEDIERRNTEFTESLFAFFKEHLKS
jgi:hypothetical protein